MFNSVSHEGGDVMTGWQYKDGASDGQPMRQYLQAQGAPSDAGFSATHVVPLSVPGSRAPARRCLVSREL
jgi:hypothetical protein